LKFYLIQKKVGKTLLKQFSLLFFILIIGCKGQNPENAEVQNHPYTNALIHETSPYLLQHAHNPVDWHAWSEATLEKAKTENKLILISVGYSACHWCHVMEHESFEDSLVAQVMNKKASIAVVEVNTDAPVFEKPFIKNAISNWSKQFDNTYGGMDVTQKFT